MCFVGIASVTRRRGPMVALYGKAILLTVLAAICTFAKAQNGTLPLVVAHRGFPALIPEETIKGYTKAVSVGADYIEMDIVSTKDGVPILRHDLTLDDSTDIANHPEFASRKKSRIIPYPKGTNQTGFFIADFTLAELRTLNMTQAFAWRDQTQNVGLPIVTLDEILEFGAKQIDQGNVVGLYIETKGVEYHDQVGLGLEDKIMNSIAKSRLAKNAASVIILQSFELASLPKMASIGKSLGVDTPPLVFLLDQDENSCGPNITDSQLATLPGLGVNYIGPWKDSLVNYTLSTSCNQLTNVTTKFAACTSQTNQTCVGKLAPEFAAAYNGTGDYPRTLVDKAHDLGIGVHAYTFRNEGRYMALDFNNDPLQELDFFGPNGVGLDGYFGDNPRTIESYVNLLAFDSGDDMDDNALLPSAS